MTWPTKKLGELISFEKGKKMAIADNGEPYIGIDGLRTNQYAVYTRETKGIRCKPDDVLLVWDGAHAGTVGTGLSGFVGSTIVKVLHNNSLENKFLFYLLKFFQEKIRAAAQGAAIPHLNKAFVNNTKISLPPLEIQQQIVERLDKIAEAQKLNDGLIQKADELFQSLLHQEFNPAGKNWKARKLRDILTRNDAGIWGQKPDGKDDALVLRSTNLKKDGVLDFEDVAERKIDIEKTEELKLEKGDIILEKSGGAPEQPVGRVAYFEEDGKKNYICSNFMNRIRVDEQVESKFLYYFLFRLHLTGQTKKTQFYTTGIRNLKMSLYLDTEIPLPSLKTQKQIIAKLSAVQNYKKQLVEQKSKLKELFDSVLHKSMNGNNI